MPKGSHQKLKLYYLSRIMLEHTDDEHSLTLPQIQELLEGYDVTADRKTLYQDMEELSVLGLDIISGKEGKYYTYHVGSKQFDIAELKLLVDSVQSSKFITERKSAELIKKITGFASSYEAAQLKRQVVVQGRVKTMNESIYYIVDDIHRAIAENRKIRFEYMRWNTAKRMESRKEGFYEVSPWALTWDDENYYLIAYDEAADGIKHYRVDKMKNIAVTSEKRAGKDHFKEFNLAAYSNMSFGMIGGEKIRVKLQFKEELVGVFLDRFGTDIPVLPVKGRKDWWETSVEVAVSNQFLGWVFALGSGVKIVSPKEAVDLFQKELEDRLKLYR